jgi:hypothetical protein
MAPRSMRSPTPPSLSAITRRRGLRTSAPTRALAAGVAMADQTIDIGRRLGDLELQTLGLAIRADVRGKQGRLGESSTPSYPRSATAWWSECRPHTAPILVLM